LVLQAGVSDVFQNSSGDVTAYVYHITGAGDLVYAGFLCQEFIQKLFNKIVYFLRSMKDEQLMYL
jgi:hypothetical protein